MVFLESRTVAFAYRDPAKTLPRHDDGLCDCGGSCQHERISIFLCALRELPAMLDCFEIISTSGVVLWSRSYESIGSGIINGLIKDVFIEEKVHPGASVADDASAARNPPYKKEKYTLKWTTVKDLGLIFVVSLPN